MISRIPGFAPNRSRLVVHDGIAYGVAVAADRGGGMYEQARQAFNEIDRSLSLAGSGKDKLLSVTCFLADMASKPEFNRAWDGWASTEHPPLRACLGAELEPGHLVEMLFTAVARAAG